jgi:membrane protein DedA with SNARE-associated domain
MSASVHSLRYLLDTWGYLAVFFFVAIESTGIPFPGETMLVTAAGYAGAGHLRIVWVIVAAATGAIIGDNCGYLIGRTGGRALIIRYGKYVGVDAGKLKIAERFFEKHGDKTVFFGRFIAVLRAWAAFLAGVNRMHWSKFLAFNAAGGICWAILYGVLAFKLGQNFDRIRGYVGIAGLLALIAGVVLVFFFHGRLMRSLTGVEPSEASSATEGPPSSP